MATTNEHGPNTGGAPSREGRPRATRVLIVDDEPLFRDLVTSSLEATGSMEVVGAVGRGLDAIEMAERTAPDVVVMDIELGSEPDGIRSAHQIKAANPAIGIVIVSPLFMSPGQINLFVAMLLDPLALAVEFALPAVEPDTEQKQRD